MNSTDIGYIIDFIAGFFIIQSIILRSKRHIRAEAATLYDGNPLIYESQLKAFWDGWLGIVLLVIGLILHLVHFEFSLTYSAVATFFTILVSSILRIIIQNKIKKNLLKEFPQYEKVKEKVERGEY